MMTNADADAASFGYRSLLRSRLCRRVAAAVILSILIVEGIIVVPAYQQFRNDLLLRLDEAGRAAIISSQLLHAHGELRNLLIAGTILTRRTLVRGGAIYDQDGKFLGSFGERPTLTPDPASRLRARLSTESGRYEVIWPAEDTGLPYLVVGRLDASNVRPELTVFLLEIAGVVAALSLIVPLVTMVLLGKLALLPLLQIQSSLNRASADPANADEFILPPPAGGEIRDAIEALNALLHRVSKTFRKELTMFASMVRTSSEAILILDHHGDIYFANAACLRLCGFHDISEMKASGLPLFQFKEGDDPLPLRNWAMGGRFRGEAVLIGRNERCIACEVSVERLVDERGNEPERHVVHIIDITDRKIAYDALRQSETKYRNLIEGSLQGLLIFDNESGIVYANAAAQKMFGADTLLGRTAESLVPPEEWERLADIRNTEFTEPFEAQALRHDGSTMWLTCISRNIEWEGRPARQVTLVDVTKRKAAEDQLRQSQKLQAIGQLTGGLAHDFGNLLTIVLSNLELLAERLNDKDILASHVNPALDATRRGAALVERLLTFARKQELRPQVIDPRTLIEGMLDLITRSLGSEIQVGAVFDDDLWQTTADPGQLENAILNLAVNARDAMPEGGELSILGENAVIDAGYARSANINAGEYVMLAVRDTGIGMTPDVARHVFEPFFTTKEPGKGTGLGLAQIYGFVHQSGGFVSIDTKPGVGTTIKMFLPRAVPPQAYAGDRTQAAAGRSN